MALTACGGESATPPLAGPATAAPTDLSPTATASPGLADVIEVSFSGEPGGYSVSVRVASPDTGCDSYADWWEVVSEDGDLLYRRVLLHSHVREQPFARSGGKVDIQPNDTVIVRAHMNVGGYGGSVMKGTVAGGFSSARVSAEFASGLESQDPLPSGCAF
jgi:hypothetical protein